MNRKVELLAPAGCPEGFYGAIHAGADAVYLGGRNFGARAYADNFTTQELVDCIRYAHLWGRKVYLTVNTLVKETEFPELFSYLQPVYEAGLDAVIVQDIGVMSFIQRYFSDLEIHVSTQMSITGKYGAKRLREMGAVRIVPAREISLAELKELKAESGLEVEAFIHGAMCYCYSGQCLFSSMLGGRSGNRGRCAQPCRLPYKVKLPGQSPTTDCYPLSLKDMCTIEYLPDLIEAGIDSFKIEGRMKKPEYTAGVTAIYREYIDRYYAGENRRVDWEDLQALGRLYLRSGRQSGYYFMRNGRQMVTLENPSYNGTGSEALLEDIRESFLRQRPRIKLSMKAEFRAGNPARLTLECTPPLTGELRVSVLGETVMPAQKQPVTEDNIRRQLGRLGDTVFCLEKMQVALDAGVFYPLKALNDLRRQAVEALEEALIAANHLPGSRGVCPREESIDSGQDHGIRKRKHVTAAEEDSCCSAECFHISLRTEEQLKALLDQVSGMAEPPEQVYLDAALVERAFAGRKETAAEQIRQLGRRGCHLAIALPPVMRSRDADFFDILWRIYGKHSGLFFGFLVRSMDNLGFLREKLREGVLDEYGKEAAPPAVYADASLYVWNLESLKTFDREGLNGFCLPFELNARDQKRLLEHNDLPCEKVVYGRIPLMVTANCITKTMDDCQQKRGETVSILIDRYKKRFPVVRECSYCMNTIYNSVPLSLHNEMENWRDQVDFRLDFTVEDERETAVALQYFMSGAKGEPPFGEYTTGHEKRGAE